MYQNISIPPCRRRRLDPDRAYKPLDFGNGVLAGSVALDGRVLALSTYHPTHGYVTLSGVTPFPDELRHDQSAVRAYRAALAHPNAPSFGLRWNQVVSVCETYLLEDAIPLCSLQVGSLTAEVITWAPRVDGEALPAAVQAWSLRNPTDQTLSFDYVWDGVQALGRASYTQLTESGALPPVSTEFSLCYHDRALEILAPDSDIAAVVLGLSAGSSWQREDYSPLHASIAGNVSIPPGQTVQLKLIYGFGMTLAQAHAHANILTSTDLQSNLLATLDQHRTRWHALDPNVAEPVQLLVHRALAYMHDCCVLPVQQGLCLLTDHQILPLSWTRDAYYMLQALSVQSNAETLELMRRHLLWLFAIAERPSGYWGRAYLANGWPKDQVFQLDQQCYPLLELTEYAAMGGESSLVAALAEQVPSILQTILSRQAPNDALFATEETPADDPLPLPFHCSSHILLWHTLVRLAALNQRWHFTSLDLHQLAQVVKMAVRSHFVVEHEGQTLFAYAVGLGQGYHLYHDANDFPTVLAPVWGFCTVDDPVWRATMEFAFSPENKDGYFVGPYGGLGSIHTPGAWPLGDVQELLYRRLIGDERRSSDILKRLTITACWDAGLPEARDPATGAVRSRHWFAWPGAALVAALLNYGWQHWASLP
jgi:hypothetical protein